MLYKKIHRQHVRQFQKGKKFKDKFNKIHEVTSKPYPYIDRNTCGAIWVWVGKYCYRYRRLLITTDGKLRDSVEWLD